jgi:hypothetical protein
MTHGSLRDGHVARLVVLCFPPATQVLTMEWIDGERLRTAGTSAAERSAATPGVGSSGTSTSAAGGGSSFASSSSSSSSVVRDPRRLEDLAMVEVGVRCSLEHMLEEGFYHADPQ